MWKPAGTCSHASFYAGCAFTKSYVGYVHAIAHSLGGEYNVPHGLANAVIPAYDAGGLRSRRSTKSWPGWRLPQVWQIRIPRTMMLPKGLYKPSKI